MSIREHPDAVAFKEAAARYCSLLETKPADPHQWVTQVLAALVRLYACAWELPDFGLPEDAPEVRNRFDVSADDRRRVGGYVYEVLDGRTCFDWSELSNKAEEVVYLSDDLSDI